MSPQLYGLIRACSARAPRLISANNFVYARSAGNPLRVRVYARERARVY